MLESNLDTDRKHSDRWASRVERAQLCLAVSVTPSPPLNWPHSSSCDIFPWTPRDQDFLGQVP